ncbi:ABC transporter permease [Actinomycetes bacterium KLBMP 9797]
MTDPTAGAPTLATDVMPTAGSEPGAPSTKGGASGKPRGLLGDAWYDLRRKPLFWIAASLIALFVVMAAVPSLFTSVDPTYGELSRSRVGPSGDAWFGYDVQGRDIYARVIYGSRASIVVALSAVVGTVFIGLAVGVLAGFRGGWVDTLLSRIGDVFFGIPFVLGAIVILSAFNRPGTHRGQWAIMGVVILTVIVLSWPVAMRIMRSTVLSTKQADYILAARALGASNSRIIFRHLIPNCLAPLLVYATILVGAFIGAEATLSYLGVGLQSPVVSWGVMISSAQNYIRVSPHLLFFPATALILAVLSFVMLGEAVREALDPKSR